jgi:NCAIR mutase (PurE)-related protein
MNLKDLEALLGAVRDGKLGVEEGLDRLRHLPYEDLGFAKLDHHRHLRQGFPEVIFGEGKEPEQILAIAAKLRERGCPVLVTRVGRDTYDLVAGRFPEARFSAAARAVIIEEPGFHRAPGNVLVLTAGTSDIPVAEEAALTAELMVEHVERAHDVGVAGLHRLLSQERRLARADVIIAVAGMEGALPSVVAGLVSVPVIGVPTSIGYGTSFGGVAALLGMLNSCASGLTVVNIDNGFGAGYMAAQICRLVEQRRR